MHTDAYMQPYKLENLSFGITLLNITTANQAICMACN